MGQDFVKAKAPRVYAKMAFEEACAQLRDCLEINPDNWQIRQLLQKCERATQKSEEEVQQAALYPD
jgi:hypothetical protein